MPPPFAVSSWQSQTRRNPQHVSPAIRGSRTWRPTFPPSTAAETGPCQRHPLSAPTRLAEDRSPGASLGADGRQVRLGMLPEPRERRQPWPGKSAWWSGGGEQSGAVCLPVPACPRTPSPAARLEKTTFPLAANPKQTHTRHRCVLPAHEPGTGEWRGGPTSKALCSEAPRSPYGPPRRTPTPGPQQTRTHGATGSCKGPTAQG